MIKSDLSVIRKKSVGRSLTVLCSFLVIGALLLINVFRLDVFMYEYYKDKSFDQLTTTSAMKAARGNVYDSNMNLLATTATTWRVFVSPRDISTRSKKDGKNYADIISRGLSDIFGTDRETLKKNISNSKVLDVTVEKKATKDEYTRLLSFIKERGLEDLVFTEAQASRFYPEGTLAAHLLGFVGNDNQGLYGLEYSYNDVLSGKDGYYLYAKDANGNPLPGMYEDYVAPTDGSSIVTTLDSFVQRELEGILEKIRLNHKVQNRVTGIVMDVETGAILAMATTGAFNPNTPFTLDPVSQEILTASALNPESKEYTELKAKLLQSCWSNKAVSELYEPGSTFKIVTVSAALDSGCAKVSDSFSCPGYKTVGGWRIKCHKKGGHGSGFSLAYGLQMSCNPTMMTIAERLGSDTFYEYVKAFGYLEKTNIDLPGEAESIFHAEGALGTTELATASFGQRFKVTPIAQLTAIAAIANGGYLVEPYVVEKVISADGIVISEHEKTVRRKVVSEDVAKTVADILEKGVSGDGGAKNAYVDGYKVAAKTGTSEKFDILDENGRSYLRIGSTVAFSPSDSGGIATIIIVDEPQSEVKYGSVVAAPYVSELLGIILPHLEYQSSVTKEIYTVDNYVGLTVKEAQNSLSSAGVQYKLIGSLDTVVSQSPPPSTDIYKDSSVIYLFTERDEDTVAVPNLVGMTLKDANKALASLELNVKITGVTSQKYQSNLTVTEQSHPPFEKVKRGTVITIRALNMNFED